MRPHKIQQPSGFCRPSNITSTTNTSQVINGRRPSISNSTNRQKELQQENDRLKRQLKKTQQQLDMCRKQSQDYRANQHRTSINTNAPDIESLNNTIKLLREELEFRASEDKQIQKHIENYQMMNQKLRQQVQKLEDVIKNNLEASRRDDAFLSVGSCTLQSTPSSQSYRGRSSMRSRYAQKENHVLTPKSKLLNIPRQNNYFGHEVEMDLIFNDIPRPHNYLKSKIHLL